MRALRRIPVHMSYDVTVPERDGSWSTGYLAPDRAAHATSRSLATNYQGKVEWAPYALSPGDLDDIAAAYETAFTLIRPA